MNERSERMKRRKEREMNRNGIRIGSERRGETERNGRSGTKEREKWKGSGMGMKGNCTKESNTST